MPDSEPRYAWVMLAIGTVLTALNLGALSSLSVFLKPVSQEFGWPRGATALAYTAATVTIGVAGVMWGRLADRFGTRAIVIIGSLAQPTALVLLASIASLPQFYAFYILLGGFGVAAINVPIIANVGLWFARRKGTALGILSTGGPLGQIMVAFLAGQVIVAFGWRAAYLTLAVVYAVAAIPLAFMVRTPPVIAADRSGGGLARAGGTLLPAPLVVAWLSAATIFCCATMSLPIVHTVAMLTDRGMPYNQAVRVFLVIMGSGVFGRILLGRLMDYLGGLRSYFLASALQTALVFWFIRVESMPALYLLSAVFGIGFSGVMTAVWVCIRELVEPRLAATSLAVVVMFAWFGMGLGGWHGGHAYDMTGSYARPYLDAAGAGILNLIIVGALIRRVSRARAAALPAAQTARMSHRLLFLDPAHFHATLTLRMPHPRVADDIVVYAPDGPERRDFLALVERFNHRNAAPTRWKVEVVTCSDPLDRLVDERRGDVVVLAGKNGGKAHTIRRLHDAGFHVLADKPWLVAPTDLDDVRASLAGWPLVTEIMTGRHDVAAQVLQRLVAAAEVFGGFRDGTPAIEMESVHHLEKLVDGAPLRRPWWFFDVRVQGSGVVDIPTHLVDRAQWLTEGMTPTDALRLVSARASSTRVPLASFRRITGEPGLPSGLEQFVEGDALDYACNADLEFRIGDVGVRASARWELGAAGAGGDSALVVARGTRADVRLEQSARTGHRRQLMVDAHDAGAARAVEALVNTAQADFPGVHVERRERARSEVVVPAGLDGGHETHFTRVLDQFLRTIDDGRWPADVAARTVAKYALLADAVAAAATGMPARSRR